MISLTVYIKSDLKVVVMYFPQAHRLHGITRYNVVTSDNQVVVINSSDTFKALMKFMKPYFTYLCPDNIDSLPLIPNTPIHFSLAFNGLTIGAIGDDRIAVVQDTDNVFMINDMNEYFILKNALYTDIAEAEEQLQDTYCSILGGTKRCSLEQLSANAILKSIVVHKVLDIKTCITRLPLPRHMADFLRKTLTELTPKDEEK